MKQSIGFLTAVIMVLWVGAVAAYEITTHSDLSGAAADTSVIFSGDVLKNIGLTSTDSFPASNGTSSDIRTLILLGAEFEDNLSLSRPLNHFSNPLNNQPLTGLGFALGSTSPDWALEDGKNIGGQDFSLKDARQYFYDALTKSTKANRDKNFGLTFQTLGMVIHHIQDMAQLQHVRGSTT